MKRVFVFLLCLGFAAVAAADMKIVQKVKTGPVMGQPAKDSTMTIYIKGKKARNETGAADKSYQIIDIDAGRVFMVMPEKKMVMALTTEQMKQAAGMMGQLAGGQSKPTVEKLNTTHTYNGYKCNDVKVTMSGNAMMTFTSVSCVSSAIDMKEFEPFAVFSQDFGKAFGGEALAEMGGYPVHSEMKMKMMGQDIDSSTDLVSVSSDKVDDSLFVVPPDYKVQEMKMPQGHKP